MSNNKPMPVATQISAPFWEGLKARRLLIQQCNACAHWNFYPRRHCPVCLEHDLAWREVDGAATLYSYTVTRIATLPDFMDEMPQKLAVVELAEGVRINTNLVGLEGESNSNGSGSVNRSEKVSLTIAAVVTDVMVNGNLVIQGRQEVRTNREVRELTVAGIVRPEDISSANTIAHTQIAEARISYGGRGDISRVQATPAAQSLVERFSPF